MDKGERKACDISIVSPVRERYTPVSAGPQLSVAAANRYITELSAVCASAFRQIAAANQESAPFPTSTCLTFGMGLMLVSSIAGRIWDSCGGEEIVSGIAK